MEDPLRIIARDAGVFLRREARSAGYTDRMLASLRRQNIIHRVRHGAYCFADTWNAATPEQRHVILARAVVRMTPGPVALSHTTALILHGIHVWGADLTRVHVTRLATGAGRAEPDVTHHVGTCSENDTTEVSGLLVTVADRAVVEAATIVGLESGIVSADSAMHLKLCSDDELRSRARRMMHWSESRQVHAVLALMDGRSESAGESRGRYLFKAQGLPMPDLQFEVYDAHGVLVAITDYVWHDHRAFGEFDGKVKYTKFLRSGEEPGDAVFREKRREDMVRGITSYSCGRMIWGDLSRPRQTAAYFRHIFGLD